MQDTATFAAEYDDQFQLQQESSLIAHSPMESVVTLSALLTVLIAQSTRLCGLIPRYQKINSYRVI